MSTDKDNKMSVEATIWAWSLTKQQVSSLEKLILLSLADRANEKMECFPSAKRLENDCNTDIKTIYKTLDSLCSKNIIKKTGEMKGRTKSVPVYRLINVQKREEKSTPKNGLSKNEAHPKTGEVAHPKTGELSTPKNGSLNLKEEPKRRTYTTTTENPIERTAKSCSEKVVVVKDFQNQNPIIENHLSGLLVLNSEKITIKLTAAFRTNPVETKHIKSEEDFLRACEYSIIHRNDGNNGEPHTEQERIRGIIKLLKNGMFEDPKGWSNQKPINKKEIEERLQQQEKISLMKWQEEEKQRQLKNPIKTNSVKQPFKKLLGDVLKTIPNPA